MTTNRIDELVSLKLISNNLKTLRKSMNMSVDDIARVIGKSRQGYNNYENGARVIGIVDLLKLSEFYNVSIDDIVGNPFKEHNEKTVSFKHFKFVDGEITETFPKFITQVKDDVIVLSINDHEVEYYLRNQSLIPDVKLLFSYNDYFYSSVIFKIENGSLAFYNGKTIKIISKNNIEKIIILGLYAGKINKEIDITNFF